MHGQKRDEYKARLKDDATAAKLSQKAQQWNALSSELLKRRRDNTKSAHVPINKDTIGTLHLTEKLLTVNPDPIYLWNHRRELLLSLTGASGSRHLDERDDDDGLVVTTLSSSDFIRQEQILTQAALQRNPKAYGAWFHRKWSIRHYIHQILKEGKSSSATVCTDDDDSEACIIMCKAELILCGEFLMLDERNFHCWNYRRFIVGTLITLLQLGQDRSLSSYFDGAWDIQMTIEDIPLIGAQTTKLMDLSNTTLISDQSESILDQQNHDIYNLLQSEFEFTSEKICQNFSNGSAFHYRSKLLPLILHFDLSSAEVVTTKSDRIKQELEIVENAVFTEPDDQTSWWYFRFILSWARDGELSDEALEEFKLKLFDTWESIEELVEAEDGKCKWGLLGLHMIASEFCEIDKNYEDEDWVQLKNSYVIQLQELDPDRSRRYETMIEEDES